MERRLVVASRLAIVIIFLALIRLIGECFRLKYIMKEEVSFDTLKPYLIGAFICAISSFMMATLGFYSKSKTVIIIATLTVIILLLIKFRYSL